METLVIQSDKKNIVEVERFVYSVCDTFNINNYSAIISMSLLQAVENAIVHGNCNDPSKNVSITFDYFKGGVFFTVSDQGNGFEYSSKLGDKDICDTCRGLFLMQSLSDRISFLNNGATVRLDFIINGIEASRALERITSLRKYFALKTVNV